MSLFMEIETDRKLPFDARKIAELVIETSLDYVKCPYETEVSGRLTGQRMFCHFLWQIMRHREIFRIWMKMPDCFIPIQES